jgi:hypothetical protein
MTDPFEGAGRFWRETETTTISYLGYDGTASPHYRTYEIPVANFFHDMPETMAARVATPSSPQVGPTCGVHLGEQVFEIEVQQLVSWKCRVTSSSASFALQQVRGLLADGHVRLQVDAPDEVADVEEVVPPRFTVSTNDKRIAGFTDVQ